MIASSSVYARPTYPLQVCLAILAIVFVAEFLVMFLLPHLLPASPARWLEATVDASLLTLLLLPFLWLAVIRPLRLLAALRGHLLRQFVALQEEERRRIACDLHDEIGQSLTTVLLGLRTLEDGQPREVMRQRLSEMRETVNRAVQEVRRIANGLRPAALDHLGLVSALRRLSEDLCEKHQLEITVNTDLDSAARLPAPIDTAVYRIAQEALTNIVRHARAQRVGIELAVRKGHLLLEIEDDGQGLEKSAAQRTDGERFHLGLAGMAERTTLLDGKFSVETRPGDGTRIQVVIPLPESAA